MIHRIKNITVPYDKLRLHSSERNSNWSDELFNEFINSITQDDIKFYPNLEELYSKLKDHYKCNDLIVGLGSDRCIEYFFQVNKGKNLLLTSPSFPMYKVYSEIYDYNTKFINYDSLKFPIDKLIENIDSNSVCVITNPCSPIGDIIERNDIIRLLEKGVPVLIDEAYIEFSDEKSVIDLIPEYKNLYVVRTFSKAYGSAGIRLGIIASQSENVELMFNYRPVYEINNFTVKWSLLLLKNLQEVEKYVTDVKLVRKIVVEKLKNLGYDVIDGNCNWIHVRGVDNLPDQIVFKINCSIPNNGNDWIRLQITDNIDDYKWIK